MNDFEISLEIALESVKNEPKKQTDLKKECISLQREAAEAAKKARDSYEKYCKLKDSKEI